jgi:hypothetical protein
MKKNILFFLTACTYFGTTLTTNQPSWTSPSGAFNALVAGSLVTPEFQTSISHLDLNTNGTKNITKSGYYYLSNDLKFHPTNNFYLAEHGPITNEYIVDDEDTQLELTPIFYISTSNVTLNLNGKTISQSINNETAHVCAIMIAPNVSNVVIHNGAINELSGVGIIISEGCCNITIDNMQIAQCAQGGIMALGNNESTASYIQTLCITNTAVSNCDGTDLNWFELEDANVYDALGVCVQYAQNAYISQCAFTNNEQTTALGKHAFGLKMIGCQSSLVNNCVCNLNFADQENSNAYGMYLFGCDTIEINTCNCNNNESLQGNCSGILLSESSQNRVYQCRTIRNQALNGTACGIEVTGNFYFNGEVIQYHPANYNSIISCQSANNTGQTTYGFLSWGTTGTNFIQCLSQANGHVDDTTHCYGIAAITKTQEFEVEGREYPLGAIVPEGFTIIEQCTCQQNFGESTSGIYIFGKSMHVHDNWIVNNRKDGYSSYGLYDQTNPSTSLIHNNYAFGHSQNYRVLYDEESNQDLPLSSASPGDFGALGVANPYANIEWQQTTNSDID